MAHRSIEMAVVGVSVERAHHLEVLSPQIPFPLPQIHCTYLKKVKFSSLVIVVHGFVRQKTFSMW